MNEISLLIGAEKILGRAKHPFLLLIVVSSVIVSLPMTTEGSSSDSYNYRFTVNKDGFTSVNMTFKSAKTEGSSWVLVPKFSPWQNITLSGEVTAYSFSDTTSKVGTDLYFYQVLEFSFTSASSFRMKIQFNMSEGALIIEPDGMFFSPQIGFDPKSTGKAEVIFPSNFSVQRVASSGKSHYTIAKNRVSFDLVDNVVRLQIGFTTGGTPKWKQINQGVFNFQTVERYENYAHEILSLYNKTYDYLTDLFNVTLGTVKVQFFIPEFDMLLSVGGYIPFTNQTMGEININIFFVRAVNGTIQVIALHELIHHFLWKAKLSPDYFLWFHEGAAQFVSIETVDNLGYEGAAIERDRLNQGASQLISQTGENFGFLQNWTPEDQTGDTTRNYVASYYVISELAERHGGLDFYKRFFELIRPLEFEPNEWKPNEWLAFYLSMAANASVDLTLQQWGFNIRLIYTKSKISPQLIYEAEKAIDELSPVFQPYKFIAEALYQQAMLRLEHGDIDGAKRLLNATISLANLAPLLTLLTITGIFALIVYILHKRTAEPEIELPPLPPSFEETNA
jgi:hypothetical protein